MKALASIFILVATLSFSQTPDSQIGNDSLNTKLLDELIIKEINNERRKAGLSILVYNKSISDRTYKYVNWMVNEGKFEHSHTSSEVIEINRFNNKITYSDLAKDIINRWIDSPGHKDILLSSGHTNHIGVHAEVFIKEVKTYLYPAETLTFYEIKVAANFYF